MCRNFRKIVSLLLVMLFIGTMAAETSVYADIDAAASASGALPEQQNEFVSFQEEILRINDSSTLTDEEKAKAISKINFMMMSNEERTALVLSRVPKNSRSTIIKRCNVPFFKQQNTYYCGPAVTKQTIHYLTDGAISPSQSTLAKALGTTSEGSSSSDMADWLETKGFYYYRVNVNTMTIQDIINYVASGIDSYDMPPFGAVAISKSQKASTAWRYTTGGHFINISAIYQDTVSNNACRLEVTDPYITWVDSTITSGKYNVPIGDYHEVMTSFWW